MRRAALLIHGFSATPACMEPIAKPLRQRGWIVESPLLAGHGTSAWDLKKKTWREWYAGVEAAYYRLEKKADEVSVVGLSLGGLLGLLLASEHRVKKLALLATPILFQGFTMTRLLPLFAGSFLRYLYPFQPKWFGPAINDPKGRKAFENYFLLPINGAMEIVRLQEELKERLPQIMVPTLIVHSRHDTTAPFESLSYLKKHLGSRRVKTMILEKSNHVLTLDFDKDAVVREVVRFL